MSEIEIKLDGETHKKLQKIAKIYGVSPDEATIICVLSGFRRYEPEAYERAKQDYPKLVRLLENA